MTTIITRAEAKAQGLLRYFTGKACKRGHVAERSAVNATCLKCSNHRRRARYAVSPEVREKRLAASATWAATLEGRTKQRATQKAWRATPKGRANRRALDAHRRALKSLACPPWADLKAIEAIFEGCPEGHHVDHIHPLAGVKYTGSDPEWRGKRISRGLHVPWNLRPLPAEENLSKGTAFDPNDMDWFGHALVNGLHV